MAISLSVAHMHMHQFSPNGGFQPPRRFLVEQIKLLHSNFCCLVIVQKSSAPHLSFLHSPFLLLTSFAQTRCVKSQLHLKSPLSSPWHSDTGPLFQLISFCAWGIVEMGLMLATSMNIFPIPLWNP